VVLPSTQVGQEALLAGQSHTDNSHRPSSVQPSASASLRPEPTFPYIILQKRAWMAVTRSLTRASKGSAGSPKTTSTSSNEALSTRSGSAPSPPKTEDGHYIIVNHRRWRATDPAIPGDELAELKHYLALGRSGVRAAKSKGAREGDAAVQLARRRTGLAKLGLGERGQPEWWNDSQDNRRKRWESALEELKKLDEG